MLSSDTTLLADEMGLGKTIQALGVVNQDTTDRGFCVLIICPATLKYNWLKECQEWLSFEKNIIYEVFQGKNKTERYKTEGSGGSIRIRIVNYELLLNRGIRNEIEMFGYEYVILDEAHYLKNPKAKRTKIVLGSEGIFEETLRPHSRIMALTGTPILNKPKEIYTLLRTLRPSNLDNKYLYYKNFAEKFCGAFYAPWGYDDNGATNLKELNDILKKDGFMLRRLKKDVLKELPDKRYQLVEIPSAGKTVTEIGDLTIDSVKKMNFSNIESLGDLAELRHELVKGKLSSCYQHIADVLDNKKKVVVFAYHRDVIEQLEEALTKFKTVKVIGGMNAADKNNAVIEFQHGDARVFIGQIQAAGVGLTLTAADTVIFVENSFVPGEITQAIDRCHRIGQKNSVLAQFLVIKDSIEEHMMRVVLDKTKTINNILN